MSVRKSNVSQDAPAVTNGAGAAAVLAAGIGSFALAVLAFAGDKVAAVKNSLVFYKPTGTLSGVTTAATFIWLLTWGILNWRWRTRDVAVERVCGVALALLGLALLLTFPPVVDLF